METQQKKIDEQIRKDYIFGLNLNNNGYNGIIEMSYGEKTSLRIFCFCEQGDSEVILKWLSLSLQLAEKEKEIERLKERITEREISIADFVSSNPDIASAYLKYEGIDPDEVVSDGMKIIDDIKSKL
jgi:hypothetical protein